MGGIANQLNLVVQLLGPDDVAKINLFNKIQDSLLAQQRWPKLLYLPKYQAFDHQDSHENLLAANLINLYLERQFDVITNLISLPLINPERVITFEAGQFDEQQLSRHLQTTPVGQTKTNLATAIRTSQLQPLTKEPSRNHFLKLSQLNQGDLANYQAFLKHQIKLYYQLQAEGLSRQQARVVLPISWQQPGQAASQPVMEGSGKYLDKLPVPTVTKCGSQQLISANPLNELQLIGHILHELTDLDYQTAETEAQTMAYRQKSRLLRNYLKNNRGRGSSLQLVSYVFEICASLNSCLELLSQPYSSCSLQTISPNLGHPMSSKLKALPESSQQAIRTGFVRSASLYQNYHQNYGPALAENVCLLGHRVRLRLSLYPNQLYQSQDKLAKHLQSLAGSSHPIIAEELDKLQSP